MDGSKDHKEKITLEVALGLRRNHPVANRTRFPPMNLVISKLWSFGSGYRLTQTPMKQYDETLS